MAKMKTGIILQTRIEKNQDNMFLQKIKGEYLINRLLRNLNKSKKAAVYVVAVPGSDRAAIEDAVDPALARVETGSENVCERLVTIADSYDLDAVVRLSCNWTFAAPDLIDRIISHHSRGQADLTVPTGFPLGLVPEVVSVAALKKFLKIGHPNDRNRPTYQMREMNDQFTIREFNAPSIPPVHIKLTIETFREFFQATRLMEKIDAAGEVKNYRQLLSRVKAFKDDEDNYFKEIFNVVFHNRLSSRKPSIIAEMIHFFMNAVPDHPRTLNYEKMCEYTQAYNGLDIQPGETVLDVGAARSFFPLYLQQKTGCTLHLIDSFYSRQSFYDKYISMIKQSPSRDQLGTGIHVRPMDATRLSYTDRYFDKVYSICTVEHIPGDGDIDAVKEIARVLKPGGKAVITVEGADCGEYTEIWNESDKMFNGTQYIDAYKKFKNDENYTPKSHINYAKNYDFPTLVQRLVTPSGLTPLDYGFYGSSGKRLSVRRLLGEYDPFALKNYQWLAYLFYPILWYRISEEHFKHFTDIIGVVVLQKPED